MIEQRIADRYELQSRIGTGGMSRVYLAQDTVLGRQVAVKILDAETAADPSFVERFRREARAAASLNHPNIVSVYDWGAVDPNGHDAERNCLYYMVMEYVPGGNLKDLLRRRGPLPEAEVLTLGAQIADALAEAHQHGIVHRDVKPHNVLLDVRGRAKVADFGIAHAAGLTQLTVTNAVSGTAHYISPEQAQQHPVDGRSDLYSLGVVLYELLTGQEPFRGGSLVEVALKHVQEMPVPPGRLRPQISRATNALILKSLAKDPGRRYQTAAEMRDALEQALARLPESPAASGEETMPVASALPEQTEVARRPTPPTRRDGKSSEDTGRRWAWLMVVPVIVLLAGVAAAVFHTRTGPGIRTAAPPTATPHPRARPTTAPERAPPRTAPTSSKPASAVPTSTPPPAPTSTPPPAATPTSVPPVAVAPTSPAPAATAPAGSSSGATDAGQAVITFYQLVAQHRFDEAALLWTPHMLAHYSPDIYISQRFGSTRDITVRIDGVKQDGPDHAVVSVTLQERYGTPPVERTLIGSWGVTRTPSGWLLDQPRF